MDATVAPAPDTGERPDLSALATDVTVISYPKSGRTWLAFMMTRYIAEYLKLPFNKKGKAGRFHTLTPESQRPYLRDLAKRREPGRWAPVVRFVHWEGVGEHFTRLPTPEPSSPVAVLLLRDPRDVVVSHYHHVMKRHSGAIDGKEVSRLEPMSLSAFIRGDRYGFRHVLAYMDQWSRWAEKRGTQIFYYEDFVRAPKRNLARFLAVIGVSKVRPRMVSAAVEASSFEAMQRAEEQSRRERGLDDDATRRRMRKGVVGGHRSELSKDDLSWMDAELRSINNPTLARYARPRKEGRVR